MTTTINAMALLLTMLTPLWGNTEEASPAESAVSFEVLLQTGSSWDGVPLPGYSGGKPEISIVKVVIPPGATLDSHKHPVINAAVILSGEITVVSENNHILHLKPGDAVAELVNTWHYGKNEGTKLTEILVFYAGEKGKPLSIKK